ncbi:DNA repair exonuclease [Alsobacter sp. KACC 23698]|uniref:DNA repair exonuclease n=1 Tax=Alsobacter sp. KACC 23698 TaxID=3149229 RepID=A0AAU7JLR2_9HYPH
MSFFTFLHAADLHLGSPLTGLALKDEDVARRFAAASRDAFAELVEKAIAEKVAFVLIAGDVYDGDWKDTSIGLFFNREVARLARAGIPVFTIRGNHDAESEITKAVSLPETVFEFPTRKADTRRLDDLRVAIHGRSFADRAAPDNYALAYPAPVAGWFNIGMLHTSCEGSPAHAVYAPCSVQDLVGRGYDYWALGHVHERAVLYEHPHVVYPGNLQGRSVRECGPKGAVLVDVADGRVAALRPLIVDKARWAHVQVALTSEASQEALLATVRDALAQPLAETEGRLTALRVTLKGETPLHGQLKTHAAQLRDEVQAHAHRLHDDTWLEALKLATTAPPTPQAEGRDGTGLDPEALLAGLEHDPEIRAGAQEFIALLASKLPGGIADGAFDDLDAILAEARAIAAARAVA